MAGSHQRLRRLLLLLFSDDAVVKHRKHVLVAALFHDAFGVKSKVTKSLDHPFPCRVVSDYLAGYSSVGRRLRHHRLKCVATDRHVLEPGGYFVVLPSVDDTQVKR